MKLRPAVFTIFLALMAMVCLSPLPSVAQTKRTMEIDDLFRMKRVSDPQISQDGKWVAYVVSVVNKAANNSNADIWIVPATGGEPRQLTNSPKQDRHPRWSPDGSLILFESTRSGASHLYTVSPQGGEPKQITSISTEASGGIWSPDGMKIAFVSSVFPEFSDKPFQVSDALNKQQQEYRDTTKVKAKIFTKLLYRHWDGWVDGKRQHVFVMPAGGGDPRDVTPGDRDGVPTSDTFNAGDEISFSHDGSLLAYTATPVPIREESWSTNHDIYTINLITGERKQITTNPAADGCPRFSPDGKFLAYRAQSRPAFEADRWQLMLRELSTGATRSLTADFDASVEAIAWTQDGARLLFPAEEKGFRPIWMVSPKGNDVVKIVDRGTNGDVSVSVIAGLTAFTRVTINRPAEVYVSAFGGKNLTCVSKANDKLFSGLNLTEPEYVWYTGAEGAKVQMWIVKPPDFDASKKYPLVLWVHGGPQGSWGDSWSFRWAPHVWAAQGYVLGLPNPRGSTGFGQKFTDEISRDWGGKAYADVMNGLDYLCALPYVDTTRKAAAGASYGGYMMSWFQGHTDRFKTLITHCGVYNFNSMYGTTDETWFDEWEHGIPWEAPENEKFSPHKYADKFKTPNLVIHNAFDFRVPLSEGMSLFTTLQRRGIPSKFLYFPDETHFVSKPQNSELWHRTVFEWLAEYLKK